MELKHFFQKNIEKPLIGSDFDGVVSSGITPEKGVVIITGRRKETEKEMRKLLPNNNKIYFVPNPEEIDEKNGNEIIGNFKADKISELGIQKFYEDNPAQAKIIRAKNDFTEVILVKNRAKKDVTELRFLVVSSYGEILDLAIHLDKVEGYDVKLCILDSRYEKVGEGIIEKEKEWHRCLGQGYIWVMDGCENCDMQDWLREQGEYVVGTNSVLSEMENDRQKGQDWFKKAGFNQPFSKNFKDIDECISFLQENLEKKWILKQNGDAPKSINYKGKFDDNSDMMYHLDELKRGWNESEYGSFDCDLMEVVEGLEVAISGFFNGHDWLRDKDGKAQFYLNFEHKKECDGDLGETTGETGTLFYGTDEDNKLVQEVMLKKEIVKVLKETDYRGVFDINGCLTKDGYVAFEATSRFGIPGTSYEFMEGLATNTGEFLASMAMGYDNVVELVKGWGMCQVVMSKPFPVEADLDDEATSIGEKLWIIGRNGLPRADFKPDQLLHIHLENFQKTEDGDYKVATKNGYLLVCTGVGSSIANAREDLLQYIKKNIFIAGMKYRHDLGKRVEEYEKKIEENKL